jgi:Xaa-Pro aminopeptidase
MKLVTAAGIGALLVGFAGAAEASSADGSIPAILSLRERKPVMDAWVKSRLDRLVPEEMRRYGFDMWLVMCNESVEDPVFRALVPEDPWAVRRLGILVFYDRGEQGIERLLVARHPKEFYEKDWDEARETQWEALARIIRARNPRRIGINQAVKIPYGDGLTAGLKAKLVSALGPDLSARLHPAEELAVAVLERRLPEEMEVYEHVVAIARAIIREGFSSAAITPGVTTVDDLAWWFNQRIVDLGLERWAFSTASLERRRSSGEADRTIRHGDLVKCDMVLKYLGLHTDHAESAYVLRPGETRAPEGLQEALRRGNRLQDILTGEFRLGRTGNEVLAAALAKGRAAGLEPRIYTHPIGLHGHGAGAFIGLPDRQDGVPEKGEYSMHIDTAYSIELSVTAPIPEWDGQRVELPLEQEAFFSKEGVRFIGGRQTELHLVR